MVRFKSLRRGIATVFVSATMLTLPAVPAGAAPDEIPDYDGGPATALLNRYHTLEPDDGKLVKHTENMLYQPRAFAPGADVDADKFS